MYAAGVSWQDYELRLRCRLAGCSSKFHRLLLIAAYWNSGTRLFVDPQTNEVLPSRLAESLARLHGRIFEEWLSLGLREQFTELSSYLDTLAGSDRQTFVWLLQCPAMRGVLAPGGATCPQRQLFLSDLETVVGMVANADVPKRAGQSLQMSP